MTTCLIKLTRNIMHRGEFQLIFTGWFQLIFGFLHHMCKNPKIWLITSTNRWVLPLSETKRTSRKSETLRSNFQLYSTFTKTLLKHIVVLKKIYGMSVSCNIKVQIKS